MQFCNCLCFGIFNIILLCKCADKLSLEESDFRLRRRNRKHKFTSPKIQNNLFGPSPKSQVKSRRLTQFVNSIASKENIPDDFKLMKGSTPNNYTSEYAIFAAAISPDFVPRDVKDFAGSLRKYGYEGDIVLAILTNSRPTIYPFFSKFRIVVFELNLTPVDLSSKTLHYSLFNKTANLSINVIRYYFYKWWALKYSPSTQILLADFRDVFFQSNPFTYRTFEWAPPVAQLVVFQEAHPNSVITRSSYNALWINVCYGVEALRLIGHNTVSCSGTVMGIRDAIVAYVRTNHTVPFFVYEFYFFY